MFRAVVGVAAAALLGCSPRAGSGIVQGGSRVEVVRGWDRTMPEHDPPHMWCKVDSTNALAFRLAGPNFVHTVAEVRDDRDSLLRQIFEGRIKRGTTELVFATDHLPAGTYTWIVRTSEADTLQWAEFRLRDRRGFR